MTSIIHVIDICRCVDVPMLVVRTCMSWPSCVAMSVAMWSRQGRMRRPHAALWLPVARDAAMRSVSVRQRPLYWTAWSRHARSEL